jgi:signal transduction histidine kinase
VRSRVLYVDADLEKLAEFHRAFGDRFEVSPAGSGAEGLAAAEKARFAVVVVDQRLPDMSGAEFLERAKDIQPDAALMVVTANATFESAVDAINRAQVVRYMRKPWTTFEMIQALDEGVRLHGRRVQNRELEARLRREERNAAIGQLTSGLIHDLRNIAGVLGMIDLLESEWDQGSDVSDLIELLELGREKYRALLGTLRFVGTENVEAALDMGSHDVADVVKQAFRLTRQLPAVRSLARFSIDVTEARAVIDPSVLFHAVVNLVKNAAEACPPERGEVMVRCTRDEDGVRIIVEDNGPGISAELREKIFAGFHSTKGASGTGLGLLVTRRIVDGHGGRLEHANREDGGSAFSIVLRHAR